MEGERDLLLPKRGYSIGCDVFDAVPLWKRKQTYISSADDQVLGVTDAFVTSSQVKVLA